MMYRFFDGVRGCWPNSYMMGPWGIVLGVLAIAAVTVLVVLLVKALRKKGVSGNNSEALELLKAKYVSGEISEEEYMKKKKILSE